MSGVLITSKKIASKETTPMVAASFGSFGAFVMQESKKISNVPET